MLASSSASVTAAWLRGVEPACAAVAALLHPHAEVVVHDLESDRIVAIWNAFSGRRVGDPALLEELPESWREAPVQGPYRKVAPDGRELSSVSAVLFDAGGEPRGLLCVNLDRTPFHVPAQALLALFAPTVQRPRELFERDWREQIALIVDDYCRGAALARAKLSRDERRELVRRLDATGLFETRHAAEHAGTALGVSRATVYALLKEVRA